VNASQPRPARADQGERDRISTDLGASLVVDAGAGTGKTESLVSRVVNLFAPAGEATPQVRPANVAVITFTQAAAFELRSRVRERLEQQASQSAAAADPARAIIVAAALENLDDAAIQTINSFALSLLQERPLQAGLPPAIETLDETGSGLLFTDKWDEWLAAALQDSEFADALEQAMRLGLASPLKALRDIAAQFNNHWETISPAKFQPERVERVALSVLKREADVLRTLLAGCTDKEDRLYGHITESALPAIKRILSLTSLADIEAALASGTTFKSPLGVKGNWPGTRKDDQPLSDARAALAAMQAAVDDELAALRRSALCALLARVGDFAAKFAGERRSLGQAGFHDSLVWARDLLKSDPAALDHFRSRYTHVLIDEFQDTDPVQVEIAELLTHRAAPGRPSPGALFVVGDPKQSIYRFRRADIRAFNKVVSSVPEEDVVHLTNNFRSHPDRLNWVNAVFGPWMAETKGLDQAAYVPLEGGIKASGAVAGTHVWLVGDVLAGANAEKVRRAEAETLAALAAEVGAGHWRVRADGGETRASVFGDLTVLVRSRTGIEFIERAFGDRGVPFALEGQSLVFHTQDIRDLLNCLAAIDDPTDQVAVAAALRSPAFACDDVSLYRWRKAGGSFSYAAGETGLPQDTHIGPVRQAFEALGHYNLLRSSCSTPELIETFIRERRLREIALGGAQARDRLTRLGLVVELARQLHGAGRTSLREFLRWAGDRQEAGERMSESPLDQGTPDAVRVMTIHAAKGLEFPIVALAGLRPGRTRYDNVLFGPSGPDAGRVEVRTGAGEASFQTAGYEGLRESEKSAADAETARLYYVAATRAKDYLLVSVWRSDSSHDKGAVAWKIAGLSASAPPDLCGAWTPADRPSEDKGSEQPGTPPPYNHAGWKARHDLARTNGSRRSHVIATAIKSEPSPDVPAKTGSPLDDDEPWRRGRAARDFGRAVHAVLQDVDLHDASGVGALALQHARAHTLPDREVAEVQRFAEAVLNTPVLARARQAALRSRCWREVPVSAPLPDRPTSPLPARRRPEPVEGERVRHRPGLVEGVWVAPSPHPAGEREGEGAAIASQFTGDHPPLLEGIIDLIFEDPSGGLVIVDYKTDRVRDTGGDTVEGNGPLAIAAAPYFPQLGAYALATEQATGHRVSEAVIVFASLAAEGKVAEYHLPDLTGARREAGELAAAAFAQNG
jgi:ATP-dependent helicase/nuclease subunit A